MKFGTLKAVGHNLADSFASGIGLLVGIYTMDVFAEASSSECGFISVDFLTGTTEGAEPSFSLQGAIEHYRDAVPVLCGRHGVEALRHSHAAG